MSGDDAESRKAVNNAIASAGSAAVSQIVDTGRSSKQKRAENRARKAAEEAREREKSDEMAPRAETVRCRQVVRS